MSEVLRIDPETVLAPLDRGSDAGPALPDSGRGGAPRLPHRRGGRRRPHRPQSRLSRPPCAVTTVPSSPLRDFAHTGMPAPMSPRLEGERDS